MITFVLVDSSTEYSAAVSQYCRCTVCGGLLSTKLSIHTANCPYYSAVSQQRRTQQPLSFGGFAYLAQLVGWYYVCLLVLTLSVVCFTYVRTFKFSAYR